MVLTPDIESLVGLRAVSLIQPWASMLAAGLKRYETRSWGTPYRGPLLIHASRKIDHAYLARPDVTALVMAEGLTSFPTGAIVGEALMTGCVATEELADLVTDTELLVGDFGVGRFAWAMRGAKLWERPVACRGRLGIWTIKREAQHD